MANRTSQSEQVRFDVTPHRWSTWPVKDQGDAIARALALFPVVEVRTLRESLVIYVSLPNDVDLSAVHARVAAFKAQLESEPRAVLGAVAKRHFESCEEQVDRLAKFILDEVHGEPSRNEGAVDTAIRILRRCAKPIELTQHIAVSPSNTDDLQRLIKESVKALLTPSYTLPAAFDPSAPGPLQPLTKAGPLNRLREFMTEQFPGEVHSGSSDSTVVDAAVGLLRDDLEDKRHLAAFVREEVPLDLRPKDSGRRIWAVVVDIIGKLLRRNELRNVPLPESAGPIFKLGDCVRRRMGSQLMRIVACDGTTYACTAEGDDKSLGTKWFYGHELQLHLF